MRMMCAWHEKYGILPELTGDDVCHLDVIPDVIQKHANVVWKHACHLHVMHMLSAHHPESLSRSVHELCIKSSCFLVIWLVVALNFVALGSLDFFLSLTSLFQLSQKEDLKPSHVKSSNLTHLQGKWLSVTMPTAFAVIGKFDFGMCLCSQGLHQDTENYIMKTDGRKTNLSWSKFSGGNVLNFR